MFAALKFKNKLSKKGKKQEDDNQLMLQKGDHSEDLSTRSSDDDSSVFPTESNEDSQEFVFFPTESNEDSQGFGHLSEEDFRWSVQADSRIPSGTSMMGLNKSKKIYSSDMMMETMAEGPDEECYLDDEDVFLDDKPSNPKSELTLATKESCISLDEELSEKEQDPQTKEVISKKKKKKKSSKKKTKSNQGGSQEEGLSEKEETVDTEEVSSKKKKKKKKKSEKTNSGGSIGSKSSKKKPKPKDGTRKKKGG